MIVEYAAHAQQLTRGCHDRLVIELLHGYPGQCIAMHAELHPATEQDEFEQLSTAAPAAVAAHSPLAIARRQQQPAWRMQIPAETSASMLRSALRYATTRVTPRHAYGALNTLHTYDMLRRTTAPYRAHPRVQPADMPCISSSSTAPSSITASAAPPANRSPAKP